VGRKEKPAVKKSVAKQTNEVGAGTGDRKQELKYEKKVKIQKGRNGKNWALTFSTGRWEAKEGTSSIQAEKRGPSLQGNETHWRGKKKEANEMAQWDSRERNWWFGSC